MTIPTTPIINAGLLYVNGLQIANTSDLKTISLFSGYARDSKNIGDITLSSTILIKGANRGVNGVDANPLIASQFYAVYVIGDSTNYHQTAGLLSLSSSIPTLPAGYDMFRRVGWILTNSSANIVVFSQTGINECRNYYYENTINVLTNASPTTYLSIPVGSAVPPITQSNSNEVLLKILYTPSLASNTAQFTPVGGSGTGAFEFGYGVAALQTGMLSIPTINSPFQRITLKVSAGDNLTLNVAGYTDYI